MALASSLTTNEIKNAAGSEVEFSHKSQTGSTRVFQQVAETFSRPHRLTVGHQETGAGMKKRRRSVVRFDKTIISDVDNLTPITVSGYTVMDIPVGAMVANTEAANVLAELMSFLATTGAATTVLFDCTGNGAKCLLLGDL